MLVDSEVAILKNKCGNLFFENVEEDQKEWSDEEYAGNA